MNRVKNIIKEYKTYQWVVGIVLTLLMVALSIYYFSSFKKSDVYNVNFSAIKESYVENNVVLELGGISLPKGSYTMSIGYVASADSSFYALIDNEISYSETWGSTAGQIASKSYDFELKMGTDRGRLVITSDKSAPVQLAYITFASDHHIYTDGVIWGILALLAIPAIWIALVFFEKSGHKASLLVVIGLVIVQSLPFIVTRGLIQGVDTRAHMMRIEGIYYGLLDGQYPVIVQPEWNNSYGQIGVLYPNVFLYIPAVFRLLGMSQLGVCKLFLFLIVGTTGIISFASARSIFKRDWQIAMVCFGIMADNMRIHDLMSGGRLGGSLLAEMFWPLLIAGLIELFYKNRNKWYLLAFGIAGTFCCHVTSASVACILIVLVTLFCIKALAEPAVRMGIGRAIILFIGLTLGTVACFTQFYFTDWGQGQLQWSDFSATLWNIYRPFADGKWTSVLAGMIICLGIILFVRFREGKDIYNLTVRRSFVLPFFITGTILFWMSTAYFPWNILMKIPGVKYYTSMLQSGFRFLSLAGCVFAFCLPELLEVCVHHREGRRSYQSKTVIATGIMLLGLTILNIGTEGNDYLRRDDKVMLYYDEVLGEVEYTFDDYLPAGTKTEWYTSDTGYVSDEVGVKSLAYEREGTYVYYSYTCDSDGAYVEFPKFFYEGYVAEDEMAEEIPVYKGDHNRVRVYLEKSETPRIIRIWYHVPWYLTLACALSMGLWAASLMVLNAKVIKRID